MRGVVNAVVDPAGAVVSVADAATHPIRTGKDLLAWDDWASGRGDTALGKVTGSGLLTIGTYGIGKAASLARHADGHRPTAIPDEPKAPAGPSLAPAIEYATRGPKLDHVFVPKHKLDPLVERFGGRRPAPAPVRLRTHRTGTVVSRQASGSRAALHAQAESAMVERPGSPYMLDLVVDDRAPGVPADDGPLPGRTLVVTTGGELTGEVVVWIRHGRLSAMEHAWFGDEPPSAWPEPDRKSVV